MDFDFDLPGLRRENQRPKRVAGAIMEELTLLLLHQARDPRLQAVNITRVEVSPDLKHATVFFNLLPGENQKTAIRGLEKARGFFRGRIAKTLNLRYTPKLVFRYDRAADDLNHMEQLLHEIQQKDADHDRDT